MILLLLVPLVLFAFASPFRGLFGGGYWSRGFWGRPWHHHHHRGFGHFHGGHHHGRR